jgi:catechol 2,3-dioxygenase-like lactoylglutathione lyase family enzyme
MSFSCRSLSHAPVLRLCLGGLSVLLYLRAALPSAQAAPTAEGKKTVKLTHACLITQRLETLRDFYREVLQVEPQVFQSDYLEFPIGGAILSLYKQESLDKTVPGAMQAGANKSVMLEFQVADVDQEYARLKESQLPIDWVMPPATFPWGNRSIYFRDPEGNMINLYSLVKSP